MYCRVDGRCWNGWGGGSGICGLLRSLCLVVVCGLFPVCNPLVRIVFCLTRGICTFCVGGRVFYFERYGLVKFLLSCHPVVASIGGVVGDNVFRLRVPVLISVFFQ